MIELNWKNIEDGWSYVCRCLLDKRTDLIYDQRLSDGILPLPDEIGRLYPNFSGYGTGMEDSTITTGVMLDAALCRYEITGDGIASEIAKRLANGLLHCSECALSEGFIPRSICPYDAKSHYIDSSRDQYTLFIFALHRFFNSDIASNDDKKRIEKAFCSIAKRAERNVTKENEYDLLREDGKRSIVTALWGEKITNHEAERLPMIYLAAWEVSGDEHWLKKYREIREEAFVKNLPMRPDYWWMYSLQQMQMSLRLLYDADTDPEWKEKYRFVMNTVADFVLSKVGYVKGTLCACCDFNMKKGCFRNLPFEEREAYSSFGYKFLVPKHEDGEQRFFIQNGAFLITIPALCPGKEIPSDAVEVATEFYNRFDFDKHCSDSPCQYLQAFWRSKIIQ